MEQRGAGDGKRAFAPRARMALEEENAQAQQKNPHISAEAKHDRDVDTSHGDTSARRPCRRKCVHPQKRMGGLLPGGPKTSHHACHRSNQGREAHAAPLPSSAPCSTKEKTIRNEQMTLPSHDAARPGDLSIDSVTHTSQQIHKEGPKMSPKLAKDASMDPRPIMPRWTERPSEPQQWHQ